MPTGTADVTLPRISEQRWSPAKGAPGGWSMFVYAVTIFLGAFLLFQVEPMIGKYVLPWFGGTAGVWTTALLFFQVFLLFGYAYAHGVATWLRPRAQAFVHIGLLAATLLLLPIAPSDSWKPGPGDDPTI